MEKKQRSKVTEGFSVKKETGCGHIYITLCHNPGETTLIEVFATLGKAGGCAHCQLEAITRAISLGLKYGIPVSEYVDELKGIRCPSPIISEGIEILSCSDAIAGVLEEDERKHNPTDKVPPTE